MDDPFSLIVAGIEELRRQRIDSPSCVMITNPNQIRPVVLLFGSQMGKTEVGLKVIRSYILNRNDPTIFGRKRRARRNRGRLIERRRAQG